MRMAGRAESGERKAESNIGNARSRWQMRMAGLRDRTKLFALRVIRLSASLPRSAVGQVLGRQVLRSGTSVAANFREASRARSNAEFVAKLGIVEQELDETMLWFELLTASGIVREQKLLPLHQEAEELIRIMVASAKRTKNAR
jgi:four helix bundle protein